MALKPGVYIVVIIVIQSATIADQVLQQLRFNGTRVVITSGTVIEVESSSTSTTITTIAEATTCSNGNTDRRQSTILRQILRGTITK